MNKIIDTIDKDTIKKLNLHLGEAIDTEYTKLHFNEISNLIDLYERQEIEIERLHNAYKQCTWERDIFAEDMKEEIKKDCSYLALDIKTIKSEAIKEFEAKIHKKLHEAEMHGNFEPVVTREMFDSVVKEMVGEGK